MLATGNHEKVRKPELVFEDAKIKKVCVGQKFSILLKTNGEVLGSGQCNYQYKRMPFEQTLSNFPR